jgi:hypothetical protein
MCRRVFWYKFASELEKPTVSMFQFHSRRAFLPEDADSIFTGNVGKILPNYTASHRRRRLSVK